jgi:PAS domain S-box-containing protein
MTDLNSTREVLGFANRLARMGMWTLHIDERRVVWSPELEHVFGLERGSFPGTEAAFESLVSPMDLPRLRQAVAESLASGEEYCVIFRFRHSSGEWRWMEGRGLPSYDGDGKPLRIDGVGIDVTDRTMAEHARFRLAAIVESSDDAILSKTLEGIVTSWNAGATRLFGYTAEEMIGQSILKLIPEELWPEEHDILQKLRLGERIDHYETRRVAKDGTSREVSLTVSPIRDITGAVVGASKIARDIGALRRAVADREALLLSERNARAEAERLSHLKDEFLATLSHELRTPLTTILGWANLLRRRSSIGQAELKAAVETIHRNAQAQAQIIDDLLDMSRIISGKIRLQTEAIDLRDLVQVAVDGIRPTAATKNIAVSVVLENGADLVAGDAARLQQVLWNLLTNALKFTPANGSIRVTLQRSGGSMEIHVKDSGVGIQPAFLPHVFERFRQADGSTTREHGGLGLGLSIVRNLVELHGGTVAVHSDGPGLGSTFSVRLPVLQSAAWSPRPSGPARGVVVRADPLMPSLYGTRVLIVDDEPDGRALLDRLLREAGAEVRAADSGLQAIDILQCESFDVILSDIGMPGLDGYEFMRRVRALKDPRVRAVPAIAVTAYAREDDRQRSLSAGFQQHVAKPYSFPELANAIAALRGHPERALPD